MNRLTKLNIGLFVGTLVVFGAGALAAFGGGGNQPDGPALRASAQVVGAGITGEVRFIQTAVSEDFPVPTVRVIANIRGLSPGAHGFHIHERGACEPTFAAAGGHYDPSMPNDLANAHHPWHMGELPNLVANPSGNANEWYRTSRVTLSPGASTLFDADGSAIIIHRDPDQGLPGLAGGPRIACGVIHPDEQP